MSLAPFLSQSGSKNSKSLIMGCFIGNVLEWFDFAIYGFLAGVFAELFFPKLDPFSALSSSLGVFAAAFIMRPAGAILFGYLGDTWGRKKALLCALGCMALPTGLIGLLPVYDHIGPYAPLCLTLCRMLQGLSLGGEFSGSIILLTEHAPANRKSFFSSWADIGSAVGIISASVTILLLNIFLSETEIMAWGWRLPFLMSFFLAGMGYYFRHQLAETPEFLQIAPKSPTPFWPLKKLFQHYKIRMLLTVTFLMINCTGYYLLIVFIPSQNLSNLPQSYVSCLTLLNLVMMIPAVIGGAVLSDKIGQIRCLLMGYIFFMVLIFPLLYTAQYGTFVEQMVIQGLFSISLGFCIGPRSSFMAHIFPTAIRYSAVALCYNLGNAIFGGTTPLVCALLIQQTETPLGPTLYLFAASLVSLFSTLLLGRILVFPKPSIRKISGGQRHTLGYKIRM